MPIIQKIPIRNMIIDLKYELRLNVIETNRCYHKDEMKHTFLHFVELAKKLDVERSFD